MCDNQSPPCEVCGKVFASNSALYKHLRTLHDIQPQSGKSARSEANGDFKCYLCDKSFAQKWSVTRHLKDIHHIEGQEQPLEKSAAFKCDMCAKSYLQKKDLNYHMKTKHPSGNHGTSRSKMRVVSYSKDQPTESPIEETSPVLKRRQVCYSKDQTTASQIEGTSRVLRKRRVCRSKGQTTSTPVEETSQSPKRRKVCRSKGETTSIPEVKYESTNLTPTEASQISPTLISPRETLNSLFDGLFDVCNQLRDGSSIRKGIAEVQHFLNTVLLVAAEKDCVFSAPA